MKKNVMTYMNMGVLVCAALLLSVTAIVNAYAAKNEVGYVNIEKVIIGSRQGARLSRQLMATKKKLKSGAEARQKIVLNLQKKLKRAQQRKKPNAVKIRKLVNQIKTKSRSLNRFVTNANNDLKFLREDAVQEIIQRANLIIGKLAKKDGYSIIFTNRDAMSYVAKRTDITDQVIRAYNQSYK